MKKVAIAFSFFLLIVLTAFVVMLEQWAAISLRWPFIAAAISLGVLFALPGITRCRSYGVLLLAYIVFILILPFVSLSPVKPYRQFFNSITTESDQEDVLTMMKEYFPETGRFRQPTWKEKEDGSLIFWLDPSDGRYNAEIIAIAFSNGVVSRKQYVMD